MCADHYGEGPVFPTPPPPNLNPNATIELWLYPGWNWKTMADVVAAGWKGIKADDWYLGPDASWTAFYSLDPLTNGTCDYTKNPPVCMCDPCYNITDPAQIDLVLGGRPVNGVKDR